MTAPTIPSQVIECFVRNVNAEFPEEEAAKLRGFDQAIAATTTEHDALRARECAKWAVEMAKGKNQRHPHWAELKEAHQVWKDTWFGLEFGLSSAGGHHAIEDAEIQWVENSISVASILGEETGWANVPWEKLLEELVNA